MSLRGFIRALADLTTPLEGSSGVGDQTKEILFREYNEHLRVTEQKYLTVFLLFSTVSVAVAALGNQQPSAQTIYLLPVQWLLIALFSGVTLVVMLGFRVWLSRYHQCIKTIMADWNVPSRYNAFQGSTQTNAALLAVVIVIGLISTIMFCIETTP